MRKILAVLILALAFAVPSFAVLHLGVHGGYSYSSMAELNRSWEQAKYDSEHNITPTAATLSKYGNAIFGNIDFEFGEFIQFGLRTGVQYVFPAKYTGLKKVIPGLFIPVETSTDALLIPIMLGASVDLELGLPFIITGSAYGGWGIGYSFENTKYSGLGPYLAAYSGGGFMADLAASVEFTLLPFMTLGINAGYRWANISGMKAIKNINVDVPGYGTVTVDSTDPLAGASGRELAVDFSGINVGLGVNIRF